jgi:hypothetical protein
MADRLTRIAGAVGVWVLGVALISPQLARAETPGAQSPQLNRTDLTPAALQQASALIEKYLLPIAEPAPTPEQKQAIKSAMDLLHSEQAMKGQAAIERFVKIGPAALGDLRRLVSTAPAESSTGESSTTDAYPATMAAIIMRRIERAQRQPILLELISLGDDARAVLSLKIDENDAAMTAAESRIEAATAALIQGSGGSTVDASAVAAERKALMEAEASDNQLRERRDKLMEIRRLMVIKPTEPQPTAVAEKQSQPTIPPANVLGIQPMSPQPTGQWPYGGTPGVWPYNNPPVSAPANGMGTQPPPFVYNPPVITPAPGASH